jgi:hypothetical protein
MMGTVGRSNDYFDNDLPSISRLGVKAGFIGTKCLKERMPDGPYILWSTALAPFRLCSGRASVPCGAFPAILV